MEALSIILLLAGVAGAVIRPGGLPAWVVPVVAAAIALVAGTATWSGTGHALRALDQPIGFLLAAVPLAVLLDRLGFFAATARLLTEGRHPVGWLWVLAAFVTTVLNLDAGVVLLTPLYINVARQRGLDPFALALQPVILSWLASSALPVSNLTNLIAVSSTGASSVDFIGHLGLPSLAAAGVGWLCYCRLPEVVAHSGSGSASPSVEGDAGGPRVALDAGERRALRTGAVVVALVLIGFVLGRTVGIQEWEVALGADLVLLALVRDLPWRSVPVGTALVAGALATLAAGAVAHVPQTAHLLGGTDLLGLARTAGVSALLANVVNNLPALLVLLPAVGHHPSPTLWATLIGVNMGPVLLATGTLASLLWLETLHRLSVPARGRDITRIGFRVGLPASATGLVVLLVLHAAGLAR